MGDVINSSGTVLDHIVYDAYGDVLSQTNSVNQPRFAFAGMQLDPVTGLYYDNARYYDSSTGQFISQDPSGFAGGNTKLQGYVNNDPVNLVDPTGLSPKGNSGAHPGGPGSPGNGGPGSGWPGSPGSNSNGSNRGGYQYSDDQLGDDGNWWSNFINSIINSDDYGSASNVTPSQAVQDATNLAQAVSTGAFTAAGVLSGASEIQEGLDLAEELEEEAQAINSASEAEELQNISNSQTLGNDAASINEDIAAAESNDAAAVDSSMSETNAINGDPAQAEADNAQAEPLLLP